MDVGTKLFNDRLDPNDELTHMVIALWVVLGTLIGSAVIMYIAYKKQLPRIALLVFPLMFVALAYVWISMIQDGTRLYNEKGVQALILAVILGVVSGVIIVRLFKNAKRR